MAADYTLADILTGCMALSPLCEEYACQEASRDLADRVYRLWRWQTLASHLVDYLSVVRLGRQALAQGAASWTCAGHVYSSAETLNVASVRFAVLTANARAINELLAGQHDAVLVLHRQPLFEAVLVFVKSFGDAEAGMLEAIVRSTEVCQALATTPTALRIMLRTALPKTTVPERRDLELLWTALKPFSGLLV